MRMYECHRCSSGLWWAWLKSCISSAECLSGGCLLCQGFPKDNHCGGLNFRALREPSKTIGPTTGGNQSHSRQSCARHSSKMSVSFLRLPLVRKFSRETKVFSVVFFWGGVSSQRHTHIIQTGFSLHQVLPSRRTTGHSLVFFLYQLCPGPCSISCPWKWWLTVLHLLKSPRKNKNKSSSDRLPLKPTGGNS